MPIPHSHPTLSCVLSPQVETEALCPLRPVLPGKPQPVAVSQPPVHPQGIVLSPVSRSLCQGTRPLLTGSEGGAMVSALWPIPLSGRRACAPETLTGTAVSVRGTVLPPSMLSLWPQQEHFAHHVSWGVVSTQDPPCPSHHSCLPDLLLFSLGQHFCSLGTAEAPAHAHTHTNTCTPFGQAQACNIRVRASHTGAYWVHSCLSLMPFSSLWLFPSDQEPQEYI